MGLSGEPAAWALSHRLRRLSAFSREAIVAHLCSLDKDDRHARFASASSDGDIAQYVDKIDFHNDLCVGLFATDGQLVGFIHLALHGRIGELGASVLPAWRQQGVAHALFGRSLRMAKMLGVCEIHLASGHAAAYRICVQLGYRITTGESYPRARVFLRSTLAERVAA